MTTVFFAVTEILSEIEPSRQRLKLITLYTVQTIYLTDYFVNLH